jgi:hypothetical protein
MRFCRNVKGRWLRLENLISVYSSSALAVAAGEEDGRRRTRHKLLEELAGSVELNLPVRQLQQWPAVFALPRQSRWESDIGRNPRAATRAVIITGLKAALTLL